MHANKTLVVMYPYVHFTLSLFYAVCQLACSRLISAEFEQLPKVK